jgi:hypothetical protein
MLVAFIEYHLKQQVQGIFEPASPGSREETHEIHLLLVAAVRVYVWVCALDQSKERATVKRGVTRQESDQPMQALVGRPATSSQCEPCQVLYPWAVIYGGVRERLNGILMGGV